MGYPIPSLLWDGTGWDWDGGDTILTKRYGMGFQWDIPYHWKLYLRVMLNGMLEVIFEIILKATFQSSF